ncbi:hypothetical protein [Celerinatantimonas sp. MCCC 1A17872]|uniref:hypothetical protein n=1 Tax=Celerinatantimonas sp. MCCC 1A17872 TaxID=3177514 RepID=UPI0038C39ECE
MVKKLAISIFALVGAMLGLPVQAQMHNPYDCQKQPQLCKAYLQGVVDSLNELKAQSDMQDAFSERALKSRGGQRYQWALGQYCDQNTMIHWQNWAKKQNLLPNQRIWLESELKKLNGCD